MKHISYGTAGFRDSVYIIKETVAPRLPKILQYICSINSWFKIGVMITASHNPVTDNGVKFVSETGDILSEYTSDKINIEEELTKIVNLDSNSFETWLNSVDNSYKFTVVIGYDTRPSNTSISNIIQKGLRELSCKIIDVGTVTTPELHIKTVNPTFNYSRHFTELFNSYVKSNNSINITPINITVDCANGSGSNLIKQISKQISKEISYVKFNLINTDDPTKINDCCGADYVHRTNSVPINLSKFTSKLCACFDGDADRLILINTDIKEVIDGDKIGVLILTYIKKYTDQLNLDLNTAFIQTAYANSVATEYIQYTLNTKTVCVSTGVKHLHHEAKKYDIAVYFESNGHGTVLFKAEFIDKLKQINSYASNKILNLYNLLNQLVGDAISCLLAVSYILLTEKNINFDSLYTNKPCKQYKIQVPNKDLVDLTQIQKHIQSYDKISRGFVRASGTEDCLRLYVEGDSLSDTDFETLFLKIESYCISLFTPYQ